MKSDIFRNAEGYVDKTAGKAIKNLNKPTEEERRKFKSFLEIVYSLAYICGFKIESKIVVRDLKSGKIYR